MYFYLSRFEGDGTMGAPFQPEVPDDNSGQWWMIDLRGDPTSSNGYCLLLTEHKPAVEPPQAVFLGEEIDGQLDNNQAARLSQALGIQFAPQSENTIRSVISVMLTKYASTTDSGRPKPVIAGVDGQKQIVLGPYSWVVTGKK